MKLIFCKTLVLHVGLVEMINCVTGRKYGMLADLRTE